MQTINRSETACRHRVLIAVVFTLLLSGTGLAQNAAVYTLYTSNPAPCAGPGVSTVSYYVTSSDPSQRFTVSSFDIPGSVGLDYEKISQTDAGIEIRWLKSVNGSMYANITGGGTTTALSITATADPKPTIRITANRNNVCAETPSATITLTAHVSRAGSSPQITWYVNDEQVQDWGETYTSSSFQDGDKVKAAVISNLVCASGAKATSLPVTMRIKQKISYTLTLPDEQETCDCEGVTVGANFSGLSDVTDQKYSWFVDGQPQSATTSVPCASGVYIQGQFGNVLGRPYPVKINGETTSGVRCELRYTQINGCVYDLAAETTVKIKPLNKLTVGIEVLPAHSPPVYCEDEVKFKANTNYPASEITWFNKDAVVGHGELYDPAFVDPGDVIRVEATANQGCVSKDPATNTLNTDVFKLNPRTIGTVEIVAMGHDGTRCQGKDADGNLTNGFYASVDGDNARSIDWSIAGAGTSSISNEGLVTWDEGFSGVATIHARANGCRNNFTEDSFAMTVYPAPVIPGATLDYCEFEPVVLMLPTDPGPMVLHWFDAQNNPLGTGQSFGVGLHVPGTYTYGVKGTDVHGCTSLEGTPIQVTSRSSCDEKLNWVETKGYTAGGTMISAARQYFDPAGRPLQSQSMRLSEGGQVLATQSLRDAFERTIGSTLAAPLGSTSFQYKHTFMGNDKKGQYGYADFGTPPDATGPGTLGYYYSDNNTEDTQVPRSTVPYSRTEFYNDGTGEVKFSAGPGEVYHLSDAHKTLTATVPVHRSLDDYLAKRAVALPGLSQPTTLLNEAITSVVRDANGRYTLSFSGKDGQILMTARPAASAAEAWLEVTNAVTASADPASADFSLMTYFFLTESQLIHPVGQGMTIEDVVNETAVDGMTPLGPGLYRVLLSPGGAISFSYKQWLKDIACNFYDDAGHLCVAVSPNGYRQWTSQTPYDNIDKIVYHYNFRGWLTSVTEPDAGTTEYLYRNDGKIRFSRNADQTVRRRFSYTAYDDLGRPVESGEYIGGDIVWKSVQMMDLVENTFAPGERPWPAANVNDYVITFYDVAKTPLKSLPANTTYVQTFVAGAVSYTENVQGGTWYSYDEMGRMVWMAQYIGSLKRMFVLEYTYDLSGSVLKVANKSFDTAGKLKEQFYHHYEYDADLRLTDVYISYDGNYKDTKGVPRANLRQVHYLYNLLGPLKRVELANHLQGTDYTYTIEGWLKGINDPLQANDPGRDGQNGFREDAFGMRYSYYDAMGPAPTPGMMTAMNSMASAARVNPDDVASRHDADSIRSSALAAIKESIIKSIAALPKVAGQKTDANQKEQGNGQSVTASAPPNNSVTADPGQVDDAVEASVLRDIYVQLQGDNWTDHTHWPQASAWPSSITNATFSNWHGITVAGGDIVAIALNGNNLQGSLPSSIGSLVALQSLDVGRNVISGSLPAALGNLENLTLLELGSNDLSGAIPVELQNLKNLEYLDLSVNKFDNSIPGEFGNLSRLRTLALDGNYPSFTGPLPAFIGNLTNLEYIGVTGNEFEGPIPSSWNKLTKLQMLWLYGNRLSGPVSLRNWKDLTVVLLDNNAFEGTFEAGGNNKLSFVSADYNTFTKIGDGFSTLAKLAHLHMWGNALTSIPDFKSLPSRAYFALEIEGNHLPLSMLEKNMTGAKTSPFSAFGYWPQTYAYATTMNVVEANALVIKTVDPGKYGTTTWSKQNSDGSWEDATADNQDKTGKTFSVYNARSTDAGVYRYEITNPYLDVVYTSDPVTVAVTPYPLPLQTTNEGLYNGMITAAAWRTEKIDSDDPAVAGYTGAYFYNYDDTYQVREANFFTPSADYTGYASAGNVWRLTGMTYDPNGNILSLRRFDGNGNGQHAFDYTYNSNARAVQNNRLENVAGYARYVYNGIGRLTEQYKTTGGNQFMTYDVTGKVTRVHTDKARTVQKMAYFYDARGFRLRTQDKQADTDTWYIRDAAGTVMAVYDSKAGDYTHVVRREIPIYGAGRIATLYPQDNNSIAYELADHLGNVRAVLKKDVDVFKATFEDNTKAKEQKDFQNYTSATNDLYDHTDSGTKYTKAQLLNGGYNGQVGLTKTFAVHAGDTLNVEAYAKYEDLTAPGGNLTGFATALTSAFGLSAASTGLENQAFHALNDFGNFIASGNKDDDEASPKAFLNILIFDEDYELVDAGFRQVDKQYKQTGTTKAVHQKLLLSKQVLKDGFAYVYLSNEGVDQVNVYFDDVVMTHIHSVVTQVADYGVWGDVIREQNVKDEKELRYGYQGQYAEEDKQTGWSHFELREYDPVIGRWTTMDPKGNGFSPYMGMYNNPIVGVDPDGGGPGDDMEFEYAQAKQQEEINLYDQITMSGSTLLPAVAVIEHPIETWYYMEKFEGGPHGLVYNPNMRMIYDVNHPNNGNTNGLNSWLNGGAKSIGYKFDMTDSQQAAAFWAFGKKPDGSGGRGTLWLSPVTITNPSAATAFFESQVGQEWDYNFFTNNCKHFLVHGFRAGGADIKTVGPDPSIWMNCGTTMFWNSSMKSPAPVRQPQPYMPTGSWPIMDKR